MRRTLSLESHMFSLSPSLALVLASFAVPTSGTATTRTVPDPTSTIIVHSSAGPITVDGQLGDAGWDGAAKIAAFYEASPGNNVTPPVRSMAWITYDSKYLYVAFRCDDPEPAEIRAPAVDRDGIGSDQDFVAIALDTRGDRQSAVLLLVSAAGVQGDGVRNDTNGEEDFSPDFFWSAAARITNAGWTAEMRIPFSSLRFTASSLASWGILFYRNYPRAYRYQLFSEPMPRGSNCEVCHAARLEGLDRIDPANHVVVAPHFTGQKDWQQSGTAGTPPAGRPARWQEGADVKWSPGPDHVVDLTLRPDFSQVEADQVQITANQRFALFVPEKRPFFMEGVDLLQTPIPAAYTRTFTAPRWGARVTGRLAGTDYTFLTAADAGGGSVIIPGIQGSSLVAQDFSSQASILRLRRTFTQASVGFLATDREDEGGSFNRVFGPDLQWRPGSADRITAQGLFSVTRTPNRPDLSSQWDGQRLSGSAIAVAWSHDTRNWNWQTQYGDVAPTFRARDGFVPRVGYRSFRQQVAYSVYADGLLTRILPTVVAGVYWNRDGARLEETLWPGLQLEGRDNLQADIFYKSDGERVGTTLLHASRLSLDATLSPSRAFPRVGFSATLGQGFDYANERVGRGGDVSATMDIRLIDALGLTVQVEHQWLQSARDGVNGRLFTANAGALETLWTLSGRACIRAMAQYVVTRRDPHLYSDAVARQDGDLEASLLFSYRLNWQTAFYVGYADQRTATGIDALAPAARRTFVKLSYAFQW
ncbi:MAG: DUF5916 domain-containing protein [Gemmatimonadota bacterium]